MQHTIRSIKVNTFMTFRIYPGKTTKNNAAYAGAHEASTVKVPRTKTVTMWERSSQVPDTSECHEETCQGNL